MVPTRWLALSVFAAILVIPTGGNGFSLFPKISSTAANIEQNTTTAPIKVEDVVTTSSPEKLQAADTLPQSMTSTVLGNFSPDTGFYAEVDVESSSPIIFPPDPYNINTGDMGLIGNMPVKPVNPWGSYGPYPPQSLPWDVPEVQPPVPWVSPIPYQSVGVYPWRYDQFYHYNNYYYTPQSPPWRYRRHVAPYGPWAEPMSPQFYHPQVYQYPYYYPEQYRHREPYGSPFAQIKRSLNPPEPHPLKTTKHSQGPHQDHQSTTGNSQSQAEKPKKNQIHFAVPQKTEVKKEHHQSSYEQPIRHGYQTPYIPHLRYYY